MDHLRRGTAGSVSKFFPQCVREDGVVQEDAQGHLRVCGPCAEEPILS
jgi:hypothetical protein